MEAINGLKGEELITFDQKYATYIMDQMLLAAYGVINRKEYKSFYSAYCVNSLVQHLNKAQIVAGNVFFDDRYFELALEYERWFQCQDWESTLSKAELIELGYITEDCQGK